MENSEQGKLGAKAKFFLSMIVFGLTVFQLMKTDKLLKALQYFIALLISACIVMLTVIISCGTYMILRELLK